MAPKKRKPTRPEERPVEAFHTSVDLGRFIGELRRTMDIRQSELAWRTKVSRQWLVGLEQGKPTLEIALVLRTLETLGFELLIRPSDPLPPWIVRTKQEADSRRDEVRLRRNATRRTNRALERSRRLCRNYPTVFPALE